MMSIKWSWILVVSFALAAGCSDDDEPTACEGASCVYVPTCVGCQCDDSPCSDDDVCETSTGECRAPDCRGDEDCGEGQSCMGGRCVVTDRDGDGVADVEDNCPDTPTADQTDDDGDDVGNWCDPDIDGDDVDNVQDNCVYAFNPTQVDDDGDGLGDACANTVTIVATFVSDEIVPGPGHKASLAVADRIDAGGTIPRATFSGVDSVPFELELEFVDPGEWIIIYCYNRSGSQNCRGEGDIQGAYDDAMPAALAGGETLRITIDLDP